MTGEWGRGDNYRNNLGNRKLAICENITDCWNVDWPQG